MVPNRATYHIYFQLALLHSVLGNKFIHHDNCFIYSNGTDKTGEISNDLTQVICDWFQVHIKKCILHEKYQVKSHTSPWFLAAFAATKVLAI